MSGQEHPSWTLAFYKPAYLLIAFAALWGSIIGLRRGPNHQVIMLLLFLLTISFGQSLFFVEGRHRVALMPIIWVLAGAGALDFSDRVRSRFFPVQRRV
jgi:hypothetical protein